METSFENFIKNILENRIEPKDDHDNLESQLCRLDKSEIGEPEKEFTDKDAENQKED
jgi:hypothetical protein